MATKNQIAQNIWITYVIRIALLTVLKQNCLEHIQSERVGVKLISKFCVVLRRPA